MSGPISSEEKGEIVRKYESGETQTSLALNYNISQKSVSRIIRMHYEFANKESNRPSAPAFPSSIPACVVHDQSQKFYSTHMFQNAVQSRMLYEQVGSEFSARPIAPVWSHPVQNSWSGGCERPFNWPMGYASAPFAAASSDASIPSNAFDCTFRVTHPSACRGAEVDRKSVV